MADRDFAEYGVPAAHGPGRAQRLVQMAGAASSVALVVALGLWGYRLAVRDIAGVPVIRALEGPARVAPEDPGGAIADHQGLAVNDVVAEGAAAPPAERLVLAPKPVELTLEDGPGLADGLPPEEAEVQPASMADPAAMVPPAAGADSDADPGLRRRWQDLTTRIWMCRRAPVSARGSRAWQASWAPSSRSR